MLTSLQAGLRALDLANADRVLFTLVDHPAVSPATLTALLASTAPIAIPRYERPPRPPGSHRCPPSPASSSTEPVTAKVRDVIDRHAAAIDYIDVADPGINDDIDDPALYQRAARTRGRPA